MSFRFFISPVLSRIIRERRNEREVSSRLCASATQRMGGFLPFVCVKTRQETSRLRAAVGEATPTGGTLDIKTPLYAMNLDCANHLEQNPPSPNGLLALQCLTCTVGVGEAFASAKASAIADT